MKFYSLFILLFFSILGYSQKVERSIAFECKLNDQAIEIGSTYLMPGQGNIQFETIKFYVSNIQFFQDDQLIYALEKKHHLIDLEASKSTAFTSKPGLRFNTIRFQLGVDSLTNVSGAFGGDLDPSNGMYWTWQSGYINLKLEGKSDICPARNNFFQFHLGGYQAPFNSLQSVSLAFSDQQAITVELELDSFFTQYDLTKEYQLMSPGEGAVEMARWLASLFSIN